MALRSFADVYGVYVLLPAVHLNPGEVVAHASPVTGVLDVGRYPGGSDEVAEAVTADLRAATFASEARPDVMRWKVAKLLDNLLNAVEAVCGSVPGRVAADADDPESVALRRLGRRLRAEGHTAVAAAGIDVISSDEVRARHAERMPSARSRASSRTTAPPGRA